MISPLIACSLRNTFLRLLSSRLLPDEGEIFVPTHLRILFVAQDPVLLDASVWENLTYGAPNTEIDVVKGVLKMLQMKNILAHLQAELLGNETANQEMGDEEQGLRQPNRSPVEKISDLSEPLTGRNSQSRSSRTLSMNGNSYKELPALDPQELAADAARDASRRLWMEPLTYTEKVKVSLARALIMNPHLLVLHRPFHHFDLGTADDVLNDTDAKLKYWAADDPYSFSSHVRHAAKRSWQRAIELLALRPTWDVVSCSCALRCPWSQALALMAAIAKKELRRDVICFSSAITSMETQWRWALQLLREMLEDGMEANVFTYSSAISVCDKAQQWQRALVLLDEMGLDSVEANVVSFNAAINACATSAKWTFAIALLHSMWQDKLCLPVCGQTQYQMKYFK
ncbi:unnamed protein product [Durusdinium trenchii]|uniref:Pentatricopeptide repeat-containing protein n=1 Tax=Durusdinium trenchii TaxID=1381693 RepID=A0ABP0IUI2_9DINO